LLAARNQTLPTRCLVRSEVPRTPQLSSGCLHRLATLHRHRRQSRGAQVPRPAIPPMRRQARKEALLMLQATRRGGPAKLPSPPYFQLFHARRRSPLYYPCRGIFTAKCRHCSSLLEPSAAAQRGSTSPYQGIAAACSSLRARRSIAWPIMPIRITARVFAVRADEQKHSWDCGRSSS
jgi:hypothetical protein